MSPEKELEVIMELLGLKKPIIKEPKFNIKKYVHDIIFNGPATVIIWKDGTKTVTKCSGDDAFDPEKGIMAALLKKLIGNTYNDLFTEYIPPYTDEDKEIYMKNKETVDKLLETKKLTEEQKEAILYFL